MAKIELWLEPETHKNTCDEPIFSLEKNKDKYEVREILANECWLVLNWDKDKFWLKFAILTAYEQYEGKTDATLVFFGDGPSASLRECRHTYWGDKGDGYIFYPKTRIIIAAMRALTEFFDMD